MLIRVLIFSALVLAVNLIAGIFAKELESDIVDWNQDDSSRILLLISSQYLDSFGTGDVSNLFKKPKIHKRFAKDEGVREENASEHRKIRKSIALRRRFQRNKSNEESLQAQETSQVLRVTAKPETTTSSSNNETVSEENTTEEKETPPTLKETKATTEISEPRTSSITTTTSPAPRKRTRPPVVRTEPPPVPLIAAAAALTMSESLYNHFRPLDKDVPEDHLLPFLDFGRKLVPSSKTSTSPVVRSSPSSSSTSSTNSIESATVSPSRSPPSLSVSRYHNSVHRKNNVSANSLSETISEIRVTTPREEEVHEDMDVSVVKPVVENNKVSRGRGGSAQFLRNLGGLYRKQDVVPSTTTTASKADDNVTESTSSVSNSVNKTINETNARDSAAMESETSVKESIMEDQLARAQEISKYLITTKRTYSAKLISTIDDTSTPVTKTASNDTTSTSTAPTSSRTSASSTQWTASSSLVEATIATPIFEKRRNVTSFMLLNRRPPLRGISSTRHNLSKNSSDEIVGPNNDPSNNGIDRNTVNQTLFNNSEKSELLNISSRGKTSFKLLPQNTKEESEAKNVSATSTAESYSDVENETINAAPNVSDSTTSQSSSTTETIITSSLPSPTTKILSTAVVTSVSVKGAWPSSAVTNAPHPEPTLVPPNSEETTVTSEKPPTSPSISVNNSSIQIPTETASQRNKSITLPLPIPPVEHNVTAAVPNNSTVPTVSSTTETFDTTSPRTTTLTGRLGSRRRYHLGVSSIAANSSNQTGSSTTSTTQASYAFTRSSKSPSHVRFPVFTTTRTPWRPSSTTTRSTSTLSPTSAATTSTASTTVTSSTTDVTPTEIFSTPSGLAHADSSLSFDSTTISAVPSRESATISPGKDANFMSSATAKTFPDTSEFDLPLWKLYNASTVLFPSSPGLKPAATMTAVPNTSPKEGVKSSGDMEEAFVKKDIRNGSLAGAESNKTLENDTEESVRLGASEVRPSPGVGIIVYVMSAVAIVPATIIIALTTKYLLKRRKKLLDDSDAYSDISSRRGAVTSSCQQSESDLGSPVSGTKLPRVPTHLQSWDQEKVANTGNVTSSNWEFPRSKLRLQTVLGQGNFGQVLKAEADDIYGHQGMTRLVAVKTVKEGATAREKEDLLRELEIMQHLGSHANVVTLLGCCTEKEPYLLIMEYVMYGKLLTFLRDHRTRQHYFNFSEDSDALTSRDLLVFAYCVARGMEYLTSKGIVHRDLAARNVLVDHNKLCKIADFGMSRNVREMGDVYEQRHTKGALPIRWMAPESLIYRIFTHKSDVWSFGILMWEIVTLGSTPYPAMGAREVMRRVCDGYRLERPSHCRTELFRVISWCWSADPNKRLDFSELKRELGVLLENSKNGTGYVDLESFEESKYNYNKTPVTSHRHHHHHHHHHQQQSSPVNHHTLSATATIRSMGDAEEIVINM